MSNYKNKTDSPDIIEEIIPGKNTDYKDKSIYQTSNNSQQSFSNNYDLEQTTQSVKKALEDSKRIMEKSREETRNQIPRFAQAITDTHEQAAQAATEIAENYMEYQKRVFNSFRPVYTPFFENLHNQSWNNQEFFRIIPEMYSRMISIYTENLIAFGRILNDIAFSNIGYYRSAVNDVKEHSKHLAEIGKTNNGY
ncbi:MAG TPA: hypothetical protein VFV86_10585 [Nitrososphaeraceae archaeon]|nr:hypothetical protein [Nitrososphaeraceae archaeon]